MERWDINILLVMKAMMETGSGHVIKSKQTNLLTLKCSSVIIKVEKNFMNLQFSQIFLSHIMWTTPLPVQLDNFIQDL